jgi:hypothetical protein
VAVARFTRVIQIDIVLGLSVASKNDTGVGRHEVVWYNWWIDLVLRMLYISTKVDIIAHGLSQPGSEAWRSIGSFVDEPAQKLYSRLPGFDHSHRHRYLRKDQPLNSPPYNSRRCHPTWTCRSSHQPPDFANTPAANTHVGDAHPLVQRLCDSIHEPKIPPQRDDLRVWDSDGIKDARMPGSPR